MSTLDRAERSFFDILTNGVVKEAVELRGHTKQVLGLGDSSPDDLDNLEAAAAEEPDPSGATSEVAAASPAQPATVRRGATVTPVQMVDPAPPRVVAQPPPPPPAPDAEPEPAALQDELDAEPELAQAAQDEEDAELEALPVPPSRLSHGRLFSVKGTHPMRLGEALRDRYHTDWLEWEPETLWWAIRKDFGPVGDITRDKVMALRTAANTDLPWLDWDVFENCCLAWNNIKAIFGAYQPMAPGEMAFGVQIMREIRADEAFDDEVIAYMAAILEERGFAYAPEEWFPGVQALLDRRPDSAPLRDAVAKVWAKASKIDPRQIEWREDNPIDMQVLRLAAIQLHLLEKAALRAGDPAVEGSPLSSTPTNPPVP